MFVQYLFGYHKQLNHFYYNIFLKGRNYKAFNDYEQT